MVYDVIIIWAWASGLFAWMHLNKNLKKIVLEKTDKPWTKVLLSWGERANVSNMNIDPEKDYFSQNKKFLLSVFSKFNQWDTMSFFAENWIKLIEEDRGRLILESGNSHDLLDLFLRKIKENNCEIKLNSEVTKLQFLSSDKDRGFRWKVFQITTKNQKYLTKNIIISSGWKSFFQTWTTWDGYNLAKDLWLKIIPTFPWLCWISTKKDLSELSWISTNVKLDLIDNKTKKTIYLENWPLLFTHFWLSWPIIFNTSNAIWEYLVNVWENTDYLLNNLCIELSFNLEWLPKKIINIFELDEENNKINLKLHSLRSWKEAKITTGWIDLNELDNHMQSKKHNWLYFIWEVVDVTWKTGWYNLQWAWSSAFVASEWINWKYKKN